MKNQDQKKLAQYYIQGIVIAKQMLAEVEFNGKDQDLIEIYKRIEKDAIERYQKLFGRALIRE